MIILSRSHPELIRRLFEREVPEVGERTIEVTPPNSTVDAIAQRVHPVNRDAKAKLLVDVGTADPFIEKELRPDLLERACAEAGIALTLRRQPGYDHSYYFISTFMTDHLAWHAERLNRG